MLATMALTNTSSTSTPEQGDPLIPPGASQTSRTISKPYDAVVEQTFPVDPSEPVSTMPPSKIATASRRKLVFLGCLLIILLLLGLTNFASYTFGEHQGRILAHVIANNDANTPPLQVPNGATIITQCAVGRGTQYILPANIPHGPVFNVYGGKIIGLEYMIGKDDLSNDNSFYDLPLYNQKYDHVDIGLLSKGHAGYPVPHYHVDIYAITRDASKAITCK